jgi:hypothetical protein
LLRDKGAQAVAVASAVAIASDPATAAPTEQDSGVDVFRLIELRNRLASALDL